MPYVCPTRPTMRIVVAMLCLAASGSASEAMSEPVQLAGVQGPCPYDYQEFGEDEQVTCSCDDNAQFGPVWGTSTYTNDSAICSAAIHAGLFDPDGPSGSLWGNDRQITVHGYRGCDIYQGTHRNGIDTQDYGPWSGSYYFPAAGLPGCDQTYLEPSSESRTD